MFASVKSGGAEPRPYGVNKTVADNQKSASIKSFGAEPTLRSEQKIYYQQKLSSKAGHRNPQLKEAIEKSEKI